SIARPLRRVRESAITMRYCGLRILPRRVSLILTATAVLLQAREGACHVQFGRRTLLARPVLPLSCDRRAARNRMRRQRYILPDRRARTKPARTDLVLGQLELRQVEPFEARGQLVEALGHVGQIRHPAAQSREPG